VPFTLPADDDTGAGDGPDAATTEPVASALNDVTYWFNRSNETVFADLAPGAIAAHTYDLPEDDLRRAVDFARTFSYRYAGMTGAKAAIRTTGVPLPIPEAAPGGR